MAWVFVEATEDTFQFEVLDRSRSMPVVVDFTAEWCGPALAMSPRLEDAVMEREGRVLLVKVDIDANPRLAKGYNVFSLPCMKAFRDGVEVSELHGVQPMDALTEWIASLISASTDPLVLKGDEESLRQAVEIDPERVEAAIPLARTHLSRGELDEAQAALAGLQNSFVSDGLLARIELSRTAGDPDLAPAFALLDKGETEDALDALLDAIWPGDGREDQLRRLIVGVLDELGPEFERAREYRRKLAAAVF